jgi:peptide-methionine (R)-S-oxide reductase
MLSSGSTRNTAPLLKRREISLVNSREISRACRRGLAVSIFLLPPATMDPATFIENALFTITTAFALSRLLAIGTAKLADAFNPGVKLPDAEWNELLQQGKLSRLAYDVLRHSATERPFSSELNDEKRPGIYVCAACDTELFSSQSKFDSGSGWPSFYDKLQAEVTEDNLLDKTVNLRQEVHCSKCGGHLGHVFPDGIRWGSPTGKRYCINGCALKFSSDILS